MANGRTEKQDGYCDYKFDDETYCKEKIAGEFLHESGKKIKRTGWWDKKKRNYCLFHSYNDDKGDFFYQEMQNKIKDSNDAVLKKLRESYIGPTSESQEESKKQETEIRNKNSLDFEGFYFPKKANFKNTVFEAAVNFLSSEFGGDVYFSYAMFAGEVSFRDTRFCGEANFQSVKFKQKIDFKSVRFSSVVHFPSAIFNGFSDFTSATFEGLANFSNTSFNEAVHFFEVIFSGKAYFRGVTFNVSAFFSGSRFKGLAEFQSVSFRGVVTFTLVTFNHIIYFNQAKFSAESFFFETQFYNEADFNNAIFSGGAYFDHSIFRGTADFMNTTFLERTFFNSCIFLAPCKYSYSRFFQKLDFTDVIFLLGPLDFKSATFYSENTIFHNTIFNCNVLFQEQMLKGIRFTGCYLGSASFYGSDVRDAVFINSSWNRKFLEKQIRKLIKEKRVEGQIPILDVTKTPPFIKRRAILFDEKIYESSKNPGILEKIWKKVSSDLFSFYRGIKSHLKKPAKKTRKLPLSHSGVDPSRLELDPLYLEHLYCQFKLAMDRNKMYGLANDFYYGEKMMETKRLWEERSPLKWAFLWLYRLLAGFGNSPWRAIISLILILFASSFLLIKFNGLTVADSTEAFKRCPCKSDENIKAATVRSDLRQAATLAKVEKSFLLLDMTCLVVSLNTLDKLSKEMKQGEIYGTGPPKVQARYSPKCNYLCNVFFVSLWNLTATPGGRSGYYKENGWGAYLAVFCIQYIFRPLMVALIIISVRRKVYRG